MTDSNSVQLTDWFDVTESEGTVSVRISGDWTHGGGVLPDLAGRFWHEIDSHLSENVHRIGFESTALSRWDSHLLIVVSNAMDTAAARNVVLDLEGLPEGVSALINLSRAVPPRDGAQTESEHAGWLAGIGSSTVDIVGSLSEANVFFGESLQSLGRFLRGKARFMRSDIVEFIQTTGPQALPIVGIINVLLGVILGFMGAVQLKQFGAEIYVANLVALGQTREIAPMMTAIVMAGRTGAAYAAQLGTMQVNEEIDALKTFGFSPMDFLVLPRMLALALMFPVLVLYADALGIFGGYLVGVGMLGLGTTEYIEQTRHAIDMGDILLGVVKGSVFGILVAVTGCMKGMQSGRSASAVGDATTKAVVLGIIAIIVMTAVFAVLTNMLGV